MSNQTLNKKEKAIVSILNNYSNVSLKQINQLIDATNGISGVSFVKLRGYSSDLSKQTEIQDALINIGASYANMIVKDENIFANFDLSKVDVNKFNYSNIDLNGVSLDEYKKQIIEALPIALEELNKPTTKISNDIYLNKALVFNLTTLKLSIIGQGINKQVEVKGEYKVVKSKPKTIAKELIKKAAGSKKDTLRRYKIDNFNGSIKVNKDTIEIN
jgi:hypothetical protein